MPVREPAYCGTGRADDEHARGGSAAEKQLLQRYTRQPDDQENKLDALRREIASRTGRRDAARQDLHALIGSFIFEG